MKHKDLGQEVELCTRIVSRAMSYYDDFSKAQHIGLYAHKYGRSLDFGCLDKSRK